MSHAPSDHDTNELLELLYGELDDARRATVERHVSGCQRCADELERLRVTANELDVWESPGASPAESAAVAAFALAEVRRDARRSPWWPLLAAAAGVALLFALGARVDVDGGRIELSLRVPWIDATPAAPATAPLDEDALRRLTDERIATLATELRADQLELARDVSLRESEERRRLVLALDRARTQHRRAVSDALDRLARGADRQTRRTHEALLEVASAVAVQLPTEANEVNR